MNLTIYAGNMLFLKEALQRNETKIRFGSEFCMYAIPSIDELEKAYNLTMAANKEFVYVTPRLADKQIENVKSQLKILDDLGGCTIVVNDFGTLHIISELDTLRPHLGRQLVYTPSRCPWKEITEEEVSFFTKRKIRKIFYQTALNYEPTIQFYKNLGVTGADVDYIPELFPSLKFITKRGLNISVHLLSIPVAITRKCHMARFLGEKDLETCSRPCYKKSYLMNNKILDRDLYLNGNTVYRTVEPDEKSLSILSKSGVNELVMTISPMRKAFSDDVINQLVQQN